MRELSVLKLLMLAQGAVLLRQPAQLRLQLPELLSQGGRAYRPRFGCPGRARGGRSDGDEQQTRGGQGAHAWQGG